MSNEVYTNPLTTRYASKEMSKVFSQHQRIYNFRKLWVALAESQHEMGLNVTYNQVKELQKNILPINFEVAREREKQVRHDVMAHIYAYGKQCPSASAIIHLGATSCYVTDNADIMIYNEALELLKLKLVAIISKLASFATKYKDLPTLGYTHLQPAQLVTVGKRASLWLQDFFMDYNAITELANNLRPRGLKGATGTQASFLELFGGDSQKVKQLEELVLKKLNLNKAVTVSGQTYTRKIDYEITSKLSMLAQSAYKFSNDIRLLQSMKELEEPFEDDQIGSSAMAYKRNPMRSERISALSRYLITLPTNTAITASTQWLERTLDDSANRRIVMCQAFLTADAILELTLNIVENLVVNKNVITNRIKQELPFMATETILMQCVNAGGDRQELHEAIRIHSIESAKMVKQEGKENDLINRLKSDDRFSVIHSKIDSILSPENFIGRAPEQVEELISEISSVIPLNNNHIDIKANINV